jgi:hypothetical protein
MQHPSHNEVGWVGTNKEGFRCVAGALRYDRGVCARRVDDTARIPKVEKGNHVSSMSLNTRKEKVLVINSPATTRDEWVDESCKNCVLCRGRGILAPIRIHRTLKKVNRDNADMNHRTEAEGDFDRRHLALLHGWVV